MYATILPILRCPHCGTSFELTESQKDGEEIVAGRIVCGDGHAFSIHEGILDFQSQEQELLNSWSKYSEEENDDFDQVLDAKKNDTQRKIEKDFLNGIVQETARLKAGFLLDIASGRGMLLRELLKSMDTNVEIISADLKELMQHFCGISFFSFRRPYTISAVTQIFQKIIQRMP